MFWKKKKKKKKEKLMLVDLFNDSSWIELVDRANELKKALNDIEDKKQELKDRASVTVEDLDFNYIPEPPKPPRDREVHISGKSRLKR